MCMQGFSIRTIGHMIRKCSLLLLVNPQQRSERDTAGVLQINTIVLQILLEVETCLEKVVRVTSFS